MAEKTRIEWCDSTFNPFIGCTRIGPGCDNCYAAVSTPSRTMGIKWGAGEPRKRTSASTWAQPLKWERNALAFQAEHGRRQRVFCASLADVFDNQVPEQWRVDLFRLIEATPNLDWLLLTKRIGNVGPMIVESQRIARTASMGVCAWLHRWACGDAPANVWLGATVVNQVEADRDIPKLLAMPVRVRFLSVEPMLGPINELPVAQLGGGTMDWVICGGESGPGARPMHPDWARSLRDQCAAAGVPFLFKQWGEWHPESSANYGTGPNTYRYGKVEGLSMMPSGGICVRNTADAPAGRPTVVDREALQAWHDRSKRAEGKPDADNYPFGYQWLHRVGKKAAGRLLDGVEHNGFPEVTISAIQEAMHG